MKIQQQKFQNNLCELFEVSNSTLIFYLPILQTLINFPEKIALRCSLKTLLLYFCYSVDKTNKFSSIFFGQ